MKLFLLNIMISLSFSQMNKIEFREAEKELAKASNQSIIDWNNGDLESHVSDYDENLLYLTKSGLKRGKLNFKRGLSYFFKNDVITLEIVNLKFSNISKNIILETGKYILNDKNKSNGIYSVLWRKTNEKWTIIYEQSN